MLQKSNTLSTEEVCLQDKVQHDLETSELRYRRLFETAQDGVLLIDFNTGMILDVNPFLIKMLGYSKEAFLKKHLWEVGIFKDIAASKDNFSTLQKKKYVRFEDLPLETKDGRKINVEFVANAYQVDGETIIQCNVRDITDRRKAEILLQQNESLLNESQKIAGLGSYALNILSGQWTTSGGLNKVFGIDDTYDLSVDGWSKLVHPDDRKMMVDYFQNTVLGKGKPFNKIYRIVRKNDHVTRWVHGLGKLTFNNQKKPIEMVGTIQDITRQYEIEDELKKSESSLQAILQSTFDGILAVDKEGKVLYTNDRFAKIWRIPQTVISTKDDNILLKFVLDQLADPQSFLKEVRRLYKSSKDSLDTLYFKDGRIIERSSRALVKDAEIIGRVWSFHDVTEQITYEGELEKISSQIQTIYQQTTDILYNLSVDDGTYRFVSVNNSFYKVTGLKKDQVIGKLVNEVIPEPSLSLVLAKYKEAIVKRKIVSWEEETKYPKETKYGDVSVEPMFDSKGKCTNLIGTVHDITQQKIEEVALRASEDKFSRIFESSPYALTITRIEDGKFIDVNKAFTTLSGISRKEALANTTTSLGVWAKKEDRANMMAELKSKGYLDSREFPFNTKARGMVMGLYSARMIDINGKPHILSSIADITELKQAENEIVELKDRNEAILTSIGDAVFACDKNGKVLLFNAAAEKLTGIPAEKVIGQKYDKVITFLKETNEEPLGDFVSEVLKRNEIMKNLNHTLLVSKSGDKIPVANSIAPIKGDTGEVVGCVVSFRDVTAEREIDKAKTEFVSIASHQLRTPLTAIGWYCEMLLSEDDGKLNSKQKIYATQAYNANKRMVTLMNALLNVSRLEMRTFIVEPKPVVIKDLARVVISELKSQIEKKKIILSEKYDPHVHQILADPNLLSMIMQNILSNSVKYTKAGGKVNLEVSKNKSDIIITIVDTGVGIPKDQQDKVFTKLFRADNIRQIDPDGTGLGLYIVKNILDSTGGKVSFESKEGRGTKFIVSLPSSGMVSKAGTRQLI